jgi:hypothetical protein
MMDHLVPQPKRSLNDYLVALQSTSINMIWKKLEWKIIQLKCTLMEIHLVLYAIFLL